MLTNMYPKCAQSFKKWYLSSYKFGKLYNDLGKPKPFDVTLRDGLQALSKEEQNKLTTEDKLQIYHNIISIHNPKNIEVGSIVSEKVLPVFKDTIKLSEILYDFQLKNYQNQNQNQNQNQKGKRKNDFVLIPNEEKLKSVIDNPKINYLSFITSVSNSFQKKNTKMTLEESDNDIYKMLYNLDENSSREKKVFVKLYVSCINECPIDGKIDNDFIVNRILKLNNMNVDSICLSDTCGSLTEEDFEYIIDNCVFFGFPLSKFSLHLHVKREREREIEKIIHKALDRKIINFDVSYLETGGCSVTMNKRNLAPNLSYDLYYQSLCNYIIKKTEL
jgi:isopropylmalate/homocitrate/citramalate synthase